MSPAIQLNKPKNVFYIQSFICKQIDYKYFGHQSHSDVLLS